MTSKYGNRWKKYKMNFKQEWIRVLDKLQGLEILLRLEFLNSRENVRFCSAPPLPQEFLVMDKKYINGEYKRKFNSKIADSDLFLEKNIKKIESEIHKRIINSIYMYKTRKEVIDVKSRYAFIIKDLCHKWNYLCIETRDKDYRFKMLYFVTDCFVKNNKRRNIFK